VNIVGPAKRYTALSRSAMLRLHHWCVCTEFSPGSWKNRAGAKSIKIRWARILFSDLPQAPIADLAPTAAARVRRNLGRNPPLDIGRLDSLRSSGRSLAIE